ncbi:MAG: hypothetical protein R3C40_09500 [Parvularculaceae bacterium]
MPLKIVRQQEHLVRLGQDVINHCRWIRIILYSILLNFSILYLFDLTFRHTMLAGGDAKKSEIPIDVMIVARAFPLGGAAVEHSDDSVVQSEGNTQNNQKRTRAAMDTMGAIKPSTNARSRQIPYLPRLSPSDAIDKIDLTTGYCESDKETARNLRCLNGFSQPASSGSDWNEGIAAARTAARGGVANDATTVELVWPKQTEDQYIHGFTKDLSTFGGRALRR